MCFRMPLKVACVVVFFKSAILLLLKKVTKLVTQNAYFYSVLGYFM